MNTRWLFACGLLSSFGCGGGGEEPITFDAFRALTYQEPDTGRYIYNRDELPESLEHLREAYERYVVSLNEAQGFGVTDRGLIVNRVSGQDDKWDSATAQNITYCVSQASFGSRYSAMVSAMSQAAGACEGAGRVNF